ncbi:MAG: hypothetical protein Fur0042_22250 [Cyanophyceae cyanobacterium]
MRLTKVPPWGARGGSFAPIAAGWVMGRPLEGPVSKWWASEWWASEWTAKQSFIGVHWPVSIVYGGAPQIKSIAPIP